MCGAFPPSWRVDPRRSTCLACGWEQPAPTTRKRRVLQAAGAAVIIATIGLIIWQYLSWSPLFLTALPLRVKSAMGTATPDDLSALGAICNTLGRYQCARNAYSRVIRGRPEDSFAIGSLAIALSNSGDYADALPHFERYFALGGGALDALYGYAKTLRALGRREDAIRWYYRTIQADARLLDVTGELVELLVQDSRRVEALSGIGAFVRALPGYKTYWASSVIAIEAGMVDSANPSRDPNVTLKIPAIGRHYYVPLRLGGGSHYEPFIADTGASALTFDSTWAEEAQVPVRRTGRSVLMETATGFAQGEEVLVPEVMVGPVRITNVEAVMCSSCAPLMG